MSNQDPNLLNFLKNQSLFNQSPTKRVNSRSRDRISGANRNNSPAYNQPIGGNNFTNFNNTSNPPLGSFNQGNASFSVNANGLNPSPSFNPGATNFNLSTNNYPQGTSNYVQGYQDNNNRQYTQNQTSYQTGTNFGNYGVSSNNYGTSYQQVSKVAEDRSVSSTGSYDYSNSYQAARVESLQRLERLSNKVQTQINTLNSKLQSFSSELLRVVSLNFNQTKEKIHYIVEEAFRESDVYMREFIRVQEMKFAEQILKAKLILQEEISNIEQMRLDINKPYWKNMAGVFITNEFEGRIEAVIKLCDNIEVRTVEFQSQEYQLRDVEGYLIDSVRAKLDSLRNNYFAR